jgi:hypothetical protein
MILDQTIRLEVALDTGSADCHVDYITYAADGAPSIPTPARTFISGSADHIILPIPMLGQKVFEPIRWSLYNRHSAAIVATVKTDDGTNERIFCKRSISAGATLEWDKGHGLQML